MSCFDFDSVCDRESLAIVFDLGQRMCELDEPNNWSFLALSDFPIMTTGSLGWLGAQGGGVRHRKFLADVWAMQFTRSRDGLVGVLCKVAAERAGAGLDSGSLAHPLHPAVRHMLLVSAGAQTRWFASHPPQAERIRRIHGRIYGRTQPTLREQHRGDLPTAPNAPF